jgi:hypothetical protein
VEGIVSVRKEEKGIVLDWRHLPPAWTKDYFFQSTILLNSTGWYDLEVARKK